MIILAKHSLLVKRSYPIWWINSQQRRAHNVFNGETAPVARVHTHLRIITSNLEALDVSSLYSLYDQFSGFNWREAL